MDGLEEIKQVLQYQLAGTIDYKGQATCEKFLNTVIYVGIVLSVLVGFFKQDISLMVMGYGATYVASLVYCLPIPAYRRNPVKFLDPAYTSPTSATKVSIIN